MKKKYYKVITLLRDHSNYSGNWILNGWYDLEEYLNGGWEIERVDSFDGGGGWKPSGGALVYILSKDYKTNQHETQQN